MLLVGLENCTGSRIVQEKHPEIPYVEVPILASNANRDVFEVKKALGRLGINSFPVLLNDAMNRVLPLSLIDTNFK